MTIQNKQIETAAKKVQAGGDPSTLTGEGVFYVKIVSGKTEGFFADDQGNHTQITNGDTLASGASSAFVIEIDFINGNGDPLTSMQPVSLDVNGKVVAVDVTNEALAKTITGLVTTGTADGAVTTVATGGTLENVSTSAAFGDLIYVSRTGALTNVAPDIGVNSFVANDFCILIGKIARNSLVPSQKDLIVTPTLIAQL